jgi:hypothetical protein
MSKQLDKIMAAVEQEFDWTSGMPGLRSSLIKLRPRISRLLGVNVRARVLAVTERGGHTGYHVPAAEDGAYTTLCEPETHLSIDAAVPAPEGKKVDCPHCMRIARGLAALGLQPQDFKE